MLSSVNVKTLFDHNNVVGFMKSIKPCRACKAHCCFFCDTQWVSGGYPSDILGKFLMK